MGRLKKTIHFVGNVLSTVVIGAFLLVLTYSVGRVFFMDVFTVNSSSMSPTIMPGDRVMVDKQLFGPRLYRSMDFSQGARLETMRVKGWRKIAYNDIIVFNHSAEGRWHNTEFSITTVYVKRCIGLPGDSIRVVGGIYRNNNQRDSVGLLSTQLRDRDVLLEPNILESYPFHPEVGWTIKEFGPLYVPKAGDTVKLDRINAILYKRYIEFENHTETELTPSGLSIDGISIPQYVFRQNYYFMAGDNVADSRDSRYMGLIPEEFIIGIAPRILLSRDPYTGKLNRRRALQPL